MEAIQFLSTTPEELIAGVADSLKKEFKGLLAVQKDDPEQLLTREEAAKFLKINLSTLWAWTNDKKVKAYGIGNRVYYKKSELLESLTPLNK